MTGFSRFADRQTAVSLPGMLEMSVILREGAVVIERRRMSGKVVGDEGL